MGLQASVKAKDHSGGPTGDSVRPATFGALVHGVISSRYNTTVTYLHNKNKAILKPEI